MKLSIIIPIYNVSDYINSCLQSVFTQKDINETEILLIDDCGTDDSISKAQEIINNHPEIKNIKIIKHEKNKGLSEARNTGVRHAKGDYIFFLDSDDELPINTISTFNHHLLQYGFVDYFIGNYKIIGHYDGNILQNYQKLYTNNQDIFNSYIKGFWYVMACGKFINRSFFIKNQLWFPKKRLHEDEYFSFKLALSASNMAIIEDEVYIYKIRTGSITTAKKRKNYIDNFWILTQHIKMIQNNHTLSKQIKYNYLTAKLFYYILTVFSSQLSPIEKKVLINWSKTEYLKLGYKPKDLKNIIYSIVISRPYNFILKILKSLI